MTNGKALKVVTSPQNNGALLEALGQLEAEVNEVVDAHLIVEAAIEDLEFVSEEHQLQECKYLRRALAILRNIQASLDSSSGNMKFKLRQAIETIQEVEK